MSSKKLIFKNCQITPGRKEILELLVEYRALSTRQMYSALQLKSTFKTLRRVQSDLAALKLAGMIESFQITPEYGPRSEFGWLLLKPGARQVGFDIEYGSQYRREPDREILEQTGWKLQLELSVKSCPGWSLMKPKTPGQLRTSGSGDKTPQYHKLTEVMSWKSFHQTGRWPLDGLEGHHSLGIPFSANDYLTFTPTRSVPKAVTGMHGSRGEIQIQSLVRNSTPLLKEPVEVATASEEAVVFILGPYRATRKFWQSRLQKYQQIAGKVLVFGVFENDERALGYKMLLKKEGLRVTTLSRVSTILDGIWKPA